jgi:predicted ABC-type ATPase
MRTYLDSGTSFSVETTLAGQLHFRLIRDARARGYRIELAYVGTSNVAINLERIRQRVAAGGHDVPMEDVIRRAERSFAHAPRTATLADAVAVFDNSGELMVPIMVLEDNSLQVFRATPQWAKEIAAVLHSRTA